MAGWRNLANEYFPDETFSEPADFYWFVSNQFVTEHVQIDVHLPKHSLFDDVTGDKFVSPMQEAAARTAASRLLTETFQADAKANGILNLVGMLGTLASVQRHLNIQTLGESLTPAETEFLLEQPAIVDGLRHRPQTDSGVNVRSMLAILAKEGVEPTEVFKRLVDKLAPASDYTPQHLAPSPLQSQAG